ncbi:MULTISPECIES: membrane protein insertase YidC [unclassified Moraxella]|uniref:membrane protein insertase YidC n=1 Tax=unclassified Moraxella TaxID=2685852 RepID=UPI003AF4B23F
MQKILRTLIIIAMLITGYLLILAWGRDYANVNNPNVTTAVTTTGSQDVPMTGQAGDVPTTATHATPAPTVAKADNLIQVTTDKYDIRINPVGGDVVYAALREHTARLNSPDPFVLLQEDSSRVYVAQSGLIGANGIDNAQGRANYTTTSTNFVMQPNQQTLSVPLVYQKDGVTVTKTYTFTKGQYPINISYNINNTSNQPWQGQMYAQIKRDNSKDPGLENKGAMSMSTYLGGAWGTPASSYNKLKFGNFDSDAIKASSDKGWVAIVQHYFVSALTPKDYTANFYSRESGKDHIIGFTSNPVAIAPAKQATLNTTLYAGPKQPDVLKPIAEGLDKTVDYGILWPISKFLFWVLDSVHKILGNWGWSIIALTLLVKIALMPIANKSYYSMAKMRAVAPRLQALKDEFGDDRMRMSQEMMKLYKEEKVNPMAGCLPVILQMPIFLALYWVLVESVQLRHAPWILWIKDLSSMDPLFILPLLMGGAMFFQQHLNPQPQDPMQAKMMKFMPIIFTVFMLFFPAGLVLYWTVNNLFSMAQQYLINKKVEKDQAMKDAVRNVV